MAVTVAKYIYQAYLPSNEEPGIKISSLQVHKPLLVKDQSKIGELYIEMEVLSTSPISDIDAATLKCTFRSITPSGQLLQEMGHCNVTFHSQALWLSDWANFTPTILDRIDSLRIVAEKVNNDQVQLVQREGAYKLFESFVQYGTRYQNMKEVVFDTNTLEATSTIDFRGIGLLPGPLVMDASCHLSGFVCNAVEKDKDKFAYINGGVGAMMLSSKFRPGEEGATIQNYVRMRVLPDDKTVLQGDVFVLQDGEIVGVWEQVRFKRIPRRVLNVFLPPGKK